MGSDILPKTFTVSHNNNLEIILGIGTFACISSNLRITLLGFFVYLFVQEATPFRKSIVRHYQNRVINDILKPDKI